MDPTLLKDVAARIRQLRIDYAAAHRDGMHALECGDLNRLSDAIEREQHIIDEQRELWHLIWTRPES